MHSTHPPLARAPGVLRVYRIVKFSSQGYRHQQLVLVFTLTSLIFCATGIVHAVETENQYLPFHRAFYCERTGTPLCTCMPLHPPRWSRPHWLARSLGPSQTSLSPSPQSATVTYRR